MANNIKNKVNVNNIYLMSFFDLFFALISNTNSTARTKKFVTMLMYMFHKIKILTENTIYYDVTYSVKLSTVHGTIHILCQQRTGWVGPRKLPVLLKFSTVLMLI